ncbi:hypothetical protein R4282_30275 [Rhodococcus oxybenzonivorans]|jgi:hypothetical protein|uniref:LppU family putative lipoprotein n=1 Tax=Rhodococcus TaxID=1827 RepID=UPI0013204249|nr:MULTISPECIES: hypothetical protein [Rhodococcus]MDV7357291.1 hypothetical protein [Rhodococcus oxybenzonivorans]QHE70661.1 putative lipoprotein LppU [Rhodococcus sp. WAY2]
MAGLVRRVCTAVVALSATAVLVTGCGSEVTPTAVPESGASATTTESTTVIDGQEGEDAGGDVDFEVAIGECVKLGGTITDAEIDKAACGSPESNYKVIAKAEQNSQCISDADSYYYETLGGVEQGAICLDVDWVIGGCMDVGGEDPKRIECTDPTAVDGVKVTEIVQGATSVDSCTTSSNGYEYPERKFVVCVDEL